MIGVWSIEIALEGRPRREFVTSTYQQDGSMMATTSGYAAHGMWAATGDRAARTRAMAALGPIEAQAGWQTLEAAVEVTQDGAMISLRANQESLAPGSKAARASR